MYTREWKLEKDTIRYRIALQTLIYKCNDPTSPTGDIVIFTDGGDKDLWALYEDMVAANMKAIRKEERKRLAL